MSTENRALHIYNPTHDYVLVYPPNSILSFAQLFTHLCTGTVVGCDSQGTPLKM